MSRLLSWLPSLSSAQGLPSEEPTQPASTNTAKTPMKSEPAKEESKLKTGDVHQSFEGVTFRAGKNLKMQTSAAGTATTNTKDAVFSAGKYFRSDITAQSIKDNDSNVKIEAGLDAKQSRNEIGDS